MSLTSRCIELALGPGAVRMQRWYHRVRHRVSGSARTAQLYLRADDPRAFVLLYVTLMLVRGYRLELDVVLLPIEGDPADTAQRRQRQWATTDAALFADALGLPALSPAPRKRLAGLQVCLAQSWLRHRDPSRLLTLLQAYWHGDEESLVTTINRLTANDATRAAIMFRKNKAALSERQYCVSGVLVFDGEAYEGVERIRHLTNRLRTEGLTNEDATARATLATQLDAFEVDRIRTAPAGAASQAEWFFSFRSPYSWLALDRVAAMCTDAGIELVLRPVMPMVTRGVPLPNAKKRYLLTDAAREARRHRIPFGNICDPLGGGVANALAGFLIARDRGNQLAYTRAVMQAIWAQGQDIAKPTVFSAVLRRAGIAMPDIARGDHTEKVRNETEANAKALSALGLWGVPVLTVDGFAVWGQDRLWQFATDRSTL